MNYDNSNPNADICNGRKDAGNGADPYAVSNTGYYGRFGGAFIPEILQPQLAEVKANFLAAWKDPLFRQEYERLLREYTGRPSPLTFAAGLSDRYGVEIYLKREDLNHTGSHKINNVIGQILLARRMGKRRVIAETGAGQHGVATATVAALMKMDCLVFMGRKDMERQAQNVKRMQLLGAEVCPVSGGTGTLKDATNEAIRYWISHPEDTYYLIGSVVGPDPYPQMVARFQSVISTEVKTQLAERTGSALPQGLVACIGGGSNAAGLFYRYLDEEQVQLYAVEAGGLGLDSGQHAATLSKGSIGIFQGSRTLLLQNSDGQVSPPHSLSAGLDYPAVGPLHAHLQDCGRLNVLSCTDSEAVAAARRLMRLEGIIPALESAHALAALERLPLHAGQRWVLCLSGRGDKDLEVYGAAPGLRQQV